MRAAWKDQKHSKEQIKTSARLGGEALWRKYYSDPTFRKELDDKLRESRSRGGTNSLSKLGEAGFKRRLEESGHIWVKPRFSDGLGNKLRSLGEVRVAEILIRAGVGFVVEPRIKAGAHAFYPDFSLDEQSRFIEVVGYVGDEYWNRTARKLRLLVDSHPSLEVAVVTTYLRILERKLRGIPRVTIFSPYQEVELVRWCRGNAGVH
jgi:predicted nuclease of restriction endonuclease-like RecB superfamily